VKRGEQVLEVEEGDHPRTAELAERVDLRSLDLRGKPGRPGSSISIGGSGELDLSGQRPRRDARFQGLCRAADRRADGETEGPVLRVGPRRLKRGLCEVRDDPVFSEQINRLDEVISSR